MLPTANTYRIGILLAAGRGRRMGGEKQLHPWPTHQGNRPLVAAAFDAIYPACDEMIVVLGHESSAVAEALGQRPFLAVLSDPDAPMFHSIRVGLQQAVAIADHAELLLHPADHPKVAKATLLAMANESRKHPELAVLPEYRGRGGHPVLIPASLARHLSEATCREGLAQYWRDHPDRCLRLSVDDRSVVRDVDVPDDITGTTD